jgi:hypothetical protein
MMHCNRTHQSKQDHAHWPTEATRAFSEGLGLGALGWAIWCHAGGRGLLWGKGRRKQLQLRTGTRFYHPESCAVST